MYRPVKHGAKGRFRSLTPELDRDVIERMDRQSARLDKISKRDALIARLQSDNVRDRRANAQDKEACERLEAEKAAYKAAVQAGKVVPVDFSPRQQNKPPKKAA